MDIIEIGTDVTHAGFTGVVISNAAKSYYGYCPEGSSIVRTAGGEAIVTNQDLTVEG